MKLRNFYLVETYKKWFNEINDFMTCSNSIFVKDTIDKIKEIDRVNTVILTLEIQSEPKDLMSYPVGFVMKCKNRNVKLSEIEDLMATLTHFNRREEKDIIKKLTDLGVEVE